MGPAPLQRSARGTPPRAIILRIAHHGAGLTARGIGFDARLIGALGIGRYISGLLPQVAQLLGRRLTVLAGRPDAAIVRALIGGEPELLTVNAQPYRLAEQSLLPLNLLRADLDLIHFPHYNLPLIKPGHFVVTVHDLFPFQFPEIHSGLLPRTVNQMLMRNAVRRAERIIAPSAATALAVKQYFPASAGRVLSIPEAADDRFNAARNPEAEAAWQLRLGIRPPYLFYLGQWKAYKNLPLLLDAFTLVRQTHPSAQLVIAGDDPRHPEVRQAAAGLPEGSIVLPGRLPESAVPDLYRGAAAVVLPSRAEGFGLPVIEAMACGIPVICSDLPVLRELADGIAVFCDPADPAAFARAMAQTLDAPTTALSRQLGIERARSFTWKRAARETVQAYESALGGVRLISPALEEYPGARQDQDLQVER
ncbi:MAG: glycosyltransferase family 4 protein [Chloroflexota bacterium]|nr:MAG: glycosyltransferase family 4 protein [Chloroflexota bacterium]